MFVAAGGKLASLPELKTIRQHGHAVEVRLCAENPFNDFLPCTGTMSVFELPKETETGWKHLRFETGIQSGSKISVHFDSMICKIIAWAPTRGEAISKIIFALKHTTCLGVVTNQIFLQRIMCSLNNVDYTTAFIDRNPSLLATVDLDHVEGPMMMAALLFDQLQEAPSAQRQAFASIPLGFRNQHRDRDTRTRTFVTCRLDLLGHKASSSLVVTRSGPDQYEVSKVEDETPVTAAESKVFFNKQGGPLTRRFYHATEAKPSRQHVAKLIQRGATGPVYKKSDRMIFLRMDEGSFIFRVVEVASDDDKREVAVSSVHLGGPATFILRNALSWAGKFDERGRDGTMGGGKFEIERRPVGTLTDMVPDAKRKHLSPMPCHILQILAKDGSTVKPGDGLLVMESMKTEIRINAEAAGIVKMHVQAEAKISEGVVMCEVTPVEGEEKK
jgi:acetyl/propionyl-CoA carboxylase alpha subunit